MPSKQEWGECLMMQISMQCIMRKTNTCQINQEFLDLTIQGPIEIRIGITMRVQGRVLIRAIQGRVGIKVGTRIEKVVGRKGSGVIEEPIGEAMSEIGMSLHTTVPNQKSKSRIPRVFRNKDML